MTASQITKSAMKQLEWEGFKVWRQNQVRVPGRAFTGEKGAADITGYHRKTGVRLECEVKTATDKLSDDQVRFLSEAKQSGCVTLIATVDKKGNFIFKPFEQ